MAKKSRKQRSLLDPVFKQVLADEFASYQANLQTEVEVGRLPRKIDAVLTVEAEEERQKICTETPFFYCLKHNQLEFKGRRDALTAQGYHTIDGRKHFLLSERKFLPFELTVTILCASKPQTVLTYARRLQQPFTPVADGYYKRAGYPPVYLIVINELPIIPKNYPLLLFAASEGKFREFREQVVVAGNHTYIRHAYEVRPQVTREVLTMAGISATLSREDLKFMAEDIGRELMTFLPPEERLAGMSVEERLAGINIEDLLKALNPRDRRKLLNLLLKMQASSPTAQEEQNGRSRT